jgi:hypothetical protein
MSLAFKGRMGNKYYRVNTSEKELWDGKGVGEGFLYGLWE